MGCGNEVLVAVRCRIVVRREVRVRRCDMQGCCVSGRLGVRFCPGRSIVQVVASMRNRVGAAARLVDRSACRCPWNVD